MRNPKKGQVSKLIYFTERQWLTPLILATQKAEIRRITVQSQLGKLVHEIISGKNPSQKRAGRVA
jgi:hypothetical protein